jgi:hypothetical protein
LKSDKPRHAPKPKPAAQEESALDVFNRIRARFHAFDGDEDLPLPTRRQMWKDRPLPNFDND